MNNFEALHPRNGGGGKDRTRFANKQYSDTGIPTLGTGPDLRVVMRGEQAVVMSVASEPSISLADEMPRRDGPLDPIFRMKGIPEPMDQEAFERKLEEAAQEFNANTRTPATGERPWSPPPIHEEAPAISLGDELAKPRRDRTLDPIFRMKEVPEPMDQETFERKRREAAQEFNASTRPAAAGERPWTPPPAHVEAPAISLGDELAKPRREAAQESASANAASWALGGPSPAEAKAKAAEEAAKPRRGRFSGFFGQ